MRGSTRTDRLSVNNVALFPATTAAVNDAVYFCSGLSAPLTTYSFHQWNELKINLATALAATTLTGVWEYCSRYDSTATNFSWSALTVLSDGTSGLTVTGTNSMVFTVPTDWHNHAYPLGSTTPVSGVYRWMIRYRITAISGQTTGGITAASASAVQTKRHAIEATGYATGSPLTMAQIYAADVAGGWGMVTNVGNFYNCETSIFITATTDYFDSSNELIQFQVGRSFHNRGTSRIGKLGTVAGTSREGTTMLFLSNGCNYYISKLANTLPESYFYQSAFVHITTDANQTFQGTWSYGAVSSKINTRFEGIRQLGMSDNRFVYIGIRNDAMPSGGGSGCEYPGAVIKDVSCFNTSHAFRCASSATSGLGSSIHQCDVSKVTTSPINMYQTTNTVLDLYFYAVDCFWGAWADTAKVTWQNSTPTGNLTDYKVFETYSMLIKVVDEAGTAISGATVTLTDKNATSIFSLTTNADGYVPVDSGTVTTGAADSITDSSKSWSTDQYLYKELYITGGTGVGQRRIIKKGGTATNLPMAWNFDTTPSTDSNYIIIPYVNIKEYNPASFTVGSVQSTATDFNPFTLTISKTGYETYQSVFTIGQALSEVITLKTGRLLRFDDNQNEYLALNYQKGSRAVIKPI